MADAIPAEEPLDRLIARRNANHGVVTRLFNAMDAIRTGEETNTQKLIRLTVQMDQMMLKIELLRALDERILNATEVANFEEEVNNAEIYFNGVFVRRAEFETYMEGLKPAPPANDEDAFSLNSTGSRSVHRSSKLPQLKLPHFSGDILQWVSFWDAFKAEIDDDVTMPNVTKFNYLRAQLSGDALKRIGGLSVTTHNYPKAVQLLEESFGKNTKIIYAHFRALTSLSSTTDSLAGLRTFYDTLESHVRSLESLDIEPDSYGTLLVCILLDKLHSNVRQNLARGRDDADGDEWTLEELRKAIHKEIGIMEITNINARQFNGPSRGNNTGRTENINQYTVLSNAASAAPFKGCPYCKEDGHRASQCSKFRTLDDRMKIVRQQKLCLNCLSAGHRQVDCTSRYTCHHCKDKHHSSLHDDKRVAKAKAEGTTDAAKGSATYTKSTAAPASQNVANMSTMIESSPILLKTVVNAVTSGYTEADANILFDDASQRTFITIIFAEMLGLSIIRYDYLRLSPFGATDTTAQTYPIVHLDVIALDGSKIPIEAVMVPHVASPVRSRWPINPGAIFPHLMGLKLSRQINGDQDFTVDILIGLDFYYSFVGDRLIRGCGPVAVESRLGYLLAGPTRNAEPQGTSVSTFHIGIDKEFDMTKFWTTESLGILPEVEQQSHWVQDFIKRNVYSKDGRFYARLPFKDGHLPLDTNLNVCQARTRQMVRRISKNGTLLKDYSEILQKQLDRGYIEYVPHDTTKTSGSVHYINHHPVLKPQSLTTPIRIVYDCSGRTKAGVSINDCLDEGPALQNDMLHILLRFRIHVIGLFSDIEKAFHQIMLEPAERDLFRFLYLSNPEDPESPFRTLRHAVLPFGANCSPFVLAAVIQKLLDAQPESVAVKILQRDLYVDNLVTGCPTKEEAVAFYNESRKIMESANFNLCAWNTNDPEVFKSICPDGIHAEPATTRVLGLLWNMKEDKMCYPSVPLAHLSSPNSTKRDVAKGIASIFDPMGLLSPITIRGKLLIQQLWVEKYSWDEPLPEPVVNKWNLLCKDLEKVTSFNFDRRYFQSSKAVSILHVFVDASKVAYGAAVYLSDGSTTTLAVAKGRAAPIPARTLPELELLAALIGTILAESVLKAIAKLGTKIEVQMWSDAQVVLHWLKSRKRLPIYVANRVSSINKFTKAHGATWHYCPTKENPADLLTRGISYEDFSRSQLWKTGPTWLSSPSSWPAWPPITTVITTLADAESADECHHDPVGNLSNLIDINRFSKLGRLIRTTAWVYRFINNCRLKARSRLENRKIESTKEEWVEPSPPLSAREVLTARRRWIISRQMTEFNTEINYLRSHNHQGARPALVRQLDLILRDGIICCGGRLQNSELDESTKHPALLSKSDHFTRLIIMDVHLRAAHSGVSATTAAIRQVFWIPSARQVVRKVLRKCIKCLIITGRPFQSQDPAPLPKERVRIQPPFFGTGIDLTGALHVKSSAKGGAESKVYIVLFTCTASRAIHLELVEDLTAKEFLDALRRFSNRRSTPSIIFSDNATNFESSADTIKRLMKSPDVTNFCSDRGIEWKFIVKRAPWHGGFWERLIGVTKTTLKKVLGKRKITAAELRTLITDVEAALNDRPITYVSPDKGDAEPITPSHLVYGRRIIPFPIENPPFDNDPDYSPNYTHSDITKQVNKKKELGQQLWNRWMTEYLSSLREFQQAATGKMNEVIKEGDVVLVHDEKPRLQWQMAIVEQLIRGADEKVRSAYIRMNGGRTSRPIEKLYPLEVRVGAPDDSEVITVPATPIKPKVEVAKPEPESTTKRPTRQATVAARKKIAGWIAAEKDD